MISPFTRGKNNNLGSLYIYAQGVTKMKYFYPGWNKFSDGGKAIKGNLIYYIMPDALAQHDWFTPKTTSGSTQAGLEHVSQSIKASA